VDILVNNAGTIQVGPFESMTTKDFEDAMRVMFWGMLHPTLTVLPDMLGRRSGRIVNITSIGGKVSMPHLLPYGCAKFAAVGLSEGLRAELKSQGIRVTTIVPGLMRTGSFLNAFFKGRQEKEFRWFSLGATLPLISMDAKRAARQIVDATRRGQAERVLSLPAGLLADFHGQFPGLTADLLALANRFVLPRAEGGRAEPVRGMDVRARSRSGSH
jgi:short-subunit dehydrogenase